MCHPPIKIANIKLRFNLAATLASRQRLKPVEVANINGPAEAGLYKASGILQSYRPPSRLQRPRRFGQRHPQNYFWRAVKNKAIRPERSTALSILTEYWCRRLNDAFKGLSSGAALTEPICSFSM